MILLPLTYLGPLQLFCRYYKSEKILIEEYDSYQKQSYRNRCDIYGANGRLSLSIPVRHEKGRRFRVKETKIDYATDWRRLHWKGIESAYNSSPYFEYYQDIFEPYYRKKFIFLVDLCMILNEEVLKILNLKIKPELTRAFYPPLAYNKSGLKRNEMTGEFSPSTARREGEGVGEWNNIDLFDLRNIIHPKIKIEDDHEFRIIEYTQVFSQKHGYIPNLSILDLIFNMGPESGRILSSSIN